MAETPRDKDPNRPPKYLPRIQYKPPEPDPEVEEVEGESEGQDGVDSSPKTKAASGKTADKSSPANPPRAGKPVEKSSPPANPPRAGKVDAPRTPPANPPRPGKNEPSKPKSRARASDIDGGSEKKGVLVEETPEGETFDARRRARLVVGAVAGGVFLLAAFIIFRSLRSDDVEPEGVPESGPPVAMPTGEPKAKPSPAAQDVLAKGLLAEARRLERDGRLDDAVKRVDRVIADFAEAPSAKLARDARERHNQGLPLFVAGAAVVATKADPKPPEAPAAEAEPEPAAPTPDVVATRPPENSVPPGPAAGSVMPPEAVAPSTPPANPNAALAEPRRPTGVGLPRSNVVARPLPPGFHAREEAGVHASGWPLEISCDRDGAAMVLIPAGTFMQGRDDGKPEERPAHKVQLPAYYIDQHEITGRQFSLFRPGPEVEVNDRPVVKVTLADARAYAQWAGKSIPTEAQWEMAARTSDGRLHPWGNSKAQWDRTREPKQIDPVMSFPDDLSPYGVFDLAGNAWEWTNDWFDTKYYNSLKGQIALNPPGPAKGKGKLPEIAIKGGSKDWDGSWRTGMRADARLPYLGFRCVLNVEGGPAPATPGVPNAPSAPGGGVPF